MASRQSLTRTQTQTLTPNPNPNPSPSPSSSPNPHPHPHPHPHQVATDPSEEVRKRVCQALVMLLDVQLEKLMPHMNNVVQYPQAG